MPSRVSRETEDTGAAESRTRAEPTRYRYDIAHRQKEGPAELQWNSRQQL